MSKDPFTLTVQAAENITPNVRLFRFICEDGQKISYAPGQFITVHFDHEGKKLHRSYSIANPPQEPEVIEFAAAYFAGGPGTQFLFNLKVGDKVETTGPFGRLILRDEQPQRYILIATGTGITPYRTMLPDLHQRLQKFPHLEVHVLLGVQRRQDLLFGDEFVAFAAQHPRAHFYACFSREDSLDDKPHERLGYVQETLTTLQPNPAGDIIYLCGNPAMIDVVFAQLKDAQFDPQQVRREKYIS